MEEAKRLRRRVLLTLLILPILIAGLVLAGVFAGLYVANIYKSKSTSMLFPLLFSGIGFAASLILSYYIAKHAATISEAKEEK